MEQAIVALILKTVSLKCVRMEEPAQLELIPTPVHALLVLLTAIAVH